jgi:hypothetical protein
MVIDYSEEQEKKIDDLEKKYKANVISLNAELILHEEGSAGYKEIRDKLLANIDSFLKDFEKLEIQFEQEIFDKLGGSPEAILANAKEQIPIIIDSYALPSNINLEQMKTLKSLGQWKIANGQIQSEINFAYNRILQELTPHIEAFKDDPENLQKLMDLIISELEKSDKTFGTLNIRKPQDLFQPNMLTYHSKAVDRMASVTRAPMTTEYGKGKIIKDNLTLSFDLDKKLGTAKFNVATHKLLLTFISSFTLNNSKSGVRDFDVRINLKEFAYHCGYDVYSADPKKAKNALDNARKKVNESLNMLYALSIDLEDEGEPIDCRVLQQKPKNIKGSIHIKFTDTFAKHLIQLPQTQYSVNLLGIDNKNATAYAIGIKLNEHFNYDNNQRKKTAQTIRIKSLLKVTDLPSYEDETIKKHSWTHRIRYPLEKALDDLIGYDVLKSWKYKEVTPIDDYPTWENSLIIFTLKDAPDHIERLAKKEKIIEERKVKSTSGKRKKK